MLARRTFPVLAFSVLTALALVVSGCSGGDKKPAASTSSSSPTAAASNYLDVPAGVSLTAQGSTLSVGDKATVAYQPKQNTVGALDIKVTELQKASFDIFVGWQLTKQIRTTTPYFVRATVTNVGDTNLGGRTVPLYIVDGDNKLIEPSVFTGSFKPCDGATFPATFKNGDKVKACLVYLSPHHGDLTAVSFRPTQDFNPITWTGDVAKAPGTSKKSGKKKSGGGHQKRSSKKSGGKKQG
jgi:hypothetical protein